MPQLRTGAGAISVTGATPPDNNPGPRTRTAMKSGLTAKKNNMAVPDGEASPPSLDVTIGLDAAIERSVASLLSRQNPDGHWVFDLEADATIPAEYILLRH